MIMSVDHEFGGAILRGDVNNRDGTRAEFPSGSKVQK
jgi:hypothetical protein